jgi:hypothetical protein
MSTNDTPSTSSTPSAEGASPVEGAAPLIGAAPLVGAAPGKNLTPEAQRALEEAAQRRRDIDARVAELARQKELKGRGGLEPVRYEDWEVKGLASDF